MTQKTFNLPFVGLECVLNGYRPENNFRVINPTIKIGQLWFKMGLFGMRMHIIFYEKERF